MAKTEEKVEEKTAQTRVEQLDIPGIIAKHIAGVMRDPTRMRALEIELDNYISANPEVKDTTKDFKKSIVKQFQDGSRIIDSLLNRFLSS